MLGRKSYDQNYIDDCRARIAAQPAQPSRTTS